MKAISEIVSYLLIVLLIFSLISLILFWGLPYLQKRQDEMKINLIFNDLFSEESSNSIVNKMKNSLFRKTTEKIGGYDGSWNITVANFATNEPSSIIFYFVSSVSPINSEEWVTIYGCGKEVCEIHEGFYEVKVSSERIGDSFIVKYGVFLKKLRMKDKIYNITFNVTNFDPNIRSYYFQTKFIYLSSEIRDINEREGIIIFWVR